MVQCAFTLALKAPRGADLSSLRGLLSQALPHQAQCGQLRWAPRRHRPGEGAQGGGLAASGCGVRSAPSPQPSESLCSYREPGDAGHWVPLPEEEQLRRAWRLAASSPAGLQLRCQVSLGECQPGPGSAAPGRPGTLWCPAGPAVSALPQAVGGRPVLYQVVAQHSYSAQGPEDLDLQPGDAVDVLCEGGSGARPVPPGPPGVRGLCALCLTALAPCSGPGVAGGPQRWPRRHLPQVLCGPGRPACEEPRQPPPWVARSALRSPVAGGRVLIKAACPTRAWTCSGLSRCEGLAGAPAVWGVAAPEKPLVP